MQLPSRYLLRMLLDKGKQTKRPHLNYEIGDRGVENLAFNAEEIPLLEKLAGQPHFDQQMNLLNARQQTERQFIPNTMDGDVVNYLSGNRGLDNYLKGNPGSEVEDAAFDGFTDGTVPGNPFELEKPRDWRTYFSDKQEDMQYDRSMEQFIISVLRKMANEGQ